MLGVQSIWAAIVLRAFQKSRPKEPICPQNETVKRVNKSTTYGWFTTHGKDEVLQSRNDHPLDENWSAIEELNIVKLASRPQLHPGHAQKRQLMMGRRLIFNRISIMIELRTQV